MANNEERIILTQEDITDLYYEFKRLKEVVGELMGILYDNTELPDEIQRDIEKLYIKKF